MPALIWEMKRMARGPAPRDSQVRDRMRAQRVRDTKPEIQLRRALHRRGLRYRVQRRPVPALQRTADIVFGPARVAVDVRGCFWHSCPRHGNTPENNRDWWVAKFARNVERDEETLNVWQSSGWIVVVVWEHEDFEAAASRIEQLVLARRELSGP